MLIPFLQEENRLGAERVRRSAVPSFSTGDCPSVRTPSFSGVWLTLSPTNMYNDPLVYGDGTYRRVDISNRKFPVIRTAQPFLRHAGVGEYCPDFGIL